MGGIATCKSFMDPVLVCLQDYEQVKSVRFPLLHYGTFYNGPHEGVAVMMHRDIPFQVIPLLITLQVKAVRVVLTWPCTVASSLYLLPHHLQGDTLCKEGPRNSCSQEIIFFFLAVAPTLFQIQTWTFFNINLSVGLPSAHLDFTYQVMEDQHRSDHFSVLWRSMAFQPMESRDVNLSMEIGIFLDLEAVGHWIKRSTTYLYTQLLC